MSNRKFINNFIMLDSELTPKDAFDLISEFSPEYVIINRIQNNDLFYYAYKPEFLFGMKQYWLQKNMSEFDTVNLTKFLILHEWKSHEVIKTSINSEDPKNDPEINDISKNTTSNISTIIFNNNIPIGILEPNQKTEEETGLKNNLGSQRNEIRGIARGRAVRRGVTRGTDRRRVMRVGTASPRVKRGIVRKVTTSKKINIENQVKDKFATGTIPNNVTINEPTEFKIEVKNSKPSKGKSNKLKLVVKKNEKSSKLDVLISSEGEGKIKFTGKQLRKLKVPLNNDESKPLIFKGIPKKEGFCTVTAEFYQDGNDVGSVTVKTKINAVQKPFKLVTSKNDMDTNKKNPPADMTISIIEEKDESNKYYFRILAIDNQDQSEFPENGSMKINCTKAYLTDLIDQMDLYGWKTGRNGKSVRDRSITLTEIDEHAANIGRRLYREIFPKDFREFFWEKKKSY